MATTKYFGTDGIRGEANGPVLRPDVIVRLAQATGHLVAQRCGHASPTVVIGKDTRLSGYMIESSLQAGFTSVGCTCLLLGPMPTPAVAMLTSSLRADAGVMITASHNPYADNGIKIFNPEGLKYNGAEALEIEALADAPDGVPLVSADHVGKALRVEDAVGRYMEFVKTSLPRGLRLDGVKLVVDCANGAAYKIAPRIFWELGATVVRMGCEPDGFNINAQVGATAPQALQLAVREHQAQLGIALDGDADRLILVDETGDVLDGDFILAAMAQFLHQRNKLTGGGVVATVMSNAGLADFLGTLGLELVRTPVGDHHVEAKMREGGPQGPYNLGGEQSGHLIFRDFATTGDGTLAALQVLAFLQATGQPASSLKKLYTPWAQQLENVRLPSGTNAGAILVSPSVQAAMQEAEARLGSAGRILVRKSGTEPLIRIMVEAREHTAMQAELAHLTQAVRSAV